VGSQNRHAMKRIFQKSSSVCELYSRVVKSLGVFEMFWVSSKCFFEMFFEMFGISFLGVWD